MIFILVFAFFSLLNYLVLFIFKIKAGDDYKKREFLGFLNVSLIGPIIEEISFRLPMIIIGDPDITLIILSNILFSLYHLPEIMVILKNFKKQKRLLWIIYFIKLPVTFLIGIFLTFIAINTKMIFLVIIIHCLWNFFVSLKRFRRNMKRYS